MILPIQLLSYKRTPLYIQVLKNLDIQLDRGFTSLTLAITQLSFSKHILKAL